MPSGAGGQRNGSVVARRITTAEMEKRLGVSYRTLRRYVRRGLLPPPAKVSDGNGVRLFWSASHISRVAKIHRLVAQGYSLAEVKARF